MKLGIGISLGNPPPVAQLFDPTTLVLSGYWRPPFAVPWLATATAGVSATTGSLIHNTGSKPDPTAGPTQNGYTPGAFAAASEQYMQNATIMSSLFTAGAGTILTLAWFVSEAAANASVYLDAPLFCDNNTGNLGLAINSTGAHVFAQSGGYKSKNSGAVSTGAYHLMMMRWDGTNLGITLDSAVEATVACGNLTGLTGSIFVGRSYIGPSTYLDGRILELATAAYKFSAGDYTNFKDYCNTKYALAL